MGLCCAKPEDSAPQWQENGNGEEKLQKKQTIRNNYDEDEKLNDLEREAT